MVHYPATQQAMALRPDYLNEFPLSVLQFYPPRPIRAAICRSGRARRVATPSQPDRRGSATGAGRGSAAAGPLFSPYRPYWRPLAAPACRCASWPGITSSIRVQSPAWKKHAGADGSGARPLSSHPEHYAVVRLRYRRSAHSGGGMDQDSREQYRHSCCKAMSTRG